MIDKDIILLVKPHPHELRPEIALDLIEGFNELITEDVGDNVMLLGHKDINGHALAPYLDLPQLLCTKNHCLQKSMGCILPIG